jgi:hypothetical protein
MVGALDHAFHLAAARRHRAITSPVTTSPTLLEAVPIELVILTRKLLFASAGTKADRWLVWASAEDAQSRADRMRKIIFMA